MAIETPTSVNSCAAKTHDVGKFELALSVGLSSSVSYGLGVGIGNRSRCISWGGTFFQPLSYSRGRVTEPSLHCVSRRGNYLLCILIYAFRPLPLCQPMLLEPIVRILLRFHYGGGLSSGLTDFFGER